MAKTSVEKRVLNLALQGGGSHGAFTWGVLDRLFEDPSIGIEGLSGTSAGAMNAVVAAHGWAIGGREGAREKLAEFWGKVVKAAAWSTFRRSMRDMCTGNWNIDGSPAVALADIAQRMASPYQTNPMNVSPLRDLLAGVVDIESIRKSPIKVFISATNVRTGQPRVFDQTDITIDAILASACLPLMFQAVEIDGVPYWDGGFTGNPCIWPLIYNCTSRDVAIVQINPLVREGTPHSTREIVNRMTEISFNSSLMSEMRAIVAVEKLIEQDHLAGSGVNRYKKMHVHRIHAEEDMRALGVASKMSAEAAFIAYLHDLGRKTAEAWLKEHGDGVGKRSTVDVRATYL